MPTNHGLILPGAFTFSAGGSAGNINGIHTGQNGHTGVWPLSRKGRQQLRPQPNIPNTGIVRGPPCHSLQDLNPAKRRKTDGGTLLQSTKQQNPASLMGSSYRGGPSVIVPQLAPTPVSVARHPSSSSHRANSQPQLQRASSRDGERKPSSINGEHSPAGGAQGGDRYKNDHRMHRVIENQVFPPITATISKYQQSLLKADRERIARKTINLVISEPGFIPDFEANGFMLSAHYEKKLARDARNYVDRFATDILMLGESSAPMEHRDLSRAFPRIGGMPSTSRTHPGKVNMTETPMRFVIAEELKSTSTLDQSVEKRIVDQSRRFKTRGTSASIRSANRSTTTSSSASEEEEETGMQRTYSSSPTTSFSDHLEGDISTGDITESIAVNTRIKIRTTSSSRAVASSLPTRRKAPVNRPPEATLQAQPSSNSHTFQDVQLLRIAGLDMDIDRPYLDFEEREDIRQGLEASSEFLSTAERKSLENHIFHVDFCVEEMDAVLEAVRRSGIRQKKGYIKGDPLVQATSLRLGPDSNILRVFQVIKSMVMKLKPTTEIGWNLLRRRNDTSILAFLEDVATGHLADSPQLIRADQRHILPAIISMSTLLREREVSGLAPVGICHGKQQFNFEAATHFEDLLTKQSEWTDCCGDISALSWTSSSTFICGATAHSDYHNMQYNKPGNLGVGSCSLDTLRAVPDHRIVRPVINREDNAENALEAMRQTQDPWLYTSVVSTAHSEITGLTFTASFDKTVKVWEVSGDRIDLQGTWRHAAKVNFVITSDNHGRVATASDVSRNAIRVYKLDIKDIGGSPYDTYDGYKAEEQALELWKNEEWAYFPATIAWGKSQSVINLLLVGYSPRSITANEHDIPEEKKNSGELCLWNVVEGTYVPISSSHTQNVFEVVWHPTQPIFIAATSPCGIFEPADTKTQVRLFAQNEFGTFAAIKALDCPASDINEITIMPNSSVDAYVTASCTDGNTYAWDTAQGDQPVHVFGHGESLDNPDYDRPREDADTGVKFVAWGQTCDRLYTGSSDGLVKAWDIKAPKGQAFVRKVLSVSGGISSGAFSKDFSRLVIGDATGKVHLLGVNNLDLDEDENEGSMPTNIAARNIWPDYLDKRAPKVIIPHPEPAAPLGFVSGLEEEQSAKDISRAFLEAGQLRLHPNRLVGAIQGPKYTETMLFRYEAHEDQDGMKPLLPEWQARQKRCSQPNELRLPRLSEAPSSSVANHMHNKRLDFDVLLLSDSTKEGFEEDGVDLKFEHDDNFEHEDEENEEDRLVDQDH